MTDRAMNGINATLPVARGGQAPTPPRGAPKAQGLRASRNRNTLRRAVKRNYIAIAQISLRQPPLAHSVGREIPTTLTDVTPRRHFRVPVEYGGPARLPALQRVVHHLSLIHI